MRRQLIIVVIALQVLVLLVMAGKREYIHAYGDEIYLRSAPIDPRDPFRGDFVRLSYSLNSVNFADLSEDMSEHKNKKGVVVYALLKPDYNGLYVLDYLTDKKPAEGVFLKGYTTRSWRLNNVLTMKYGIEQYFVQQGRGLEMEKKLGRRTGMQVPIEMKISVGGDGTAVIEGHRWSQLAVRLEVVREARRDEQQANNQRALSPKVKVTLKNVSGEDLSLVNFNNPCGFDLVVVDAIDTRWAADNSACAQSFTNDDVMRLQADESHSLEIDLDSFRWQVMHKNQLSKIAELNQWQRYRLVYRSPRKSQITSLLDADTIWLGSMSTPAFNGSGRVD